MAKLKQENLSNRRYPGNFEKRSALVHAELLGTSEHKFFEQHMVIYFFLVEHWYDMLCDNEGQQSALVH